MMFDWHLLCDRCHTIAEAKDAVYYPDLCNRCKAKFEAWINGLLDALEAEGAPIIDFEQHEK
jgi:hypothetical protein